MKGLAARQDAAPPRSCDMSLPHASETLRLRRYRHTNRGSRRSTTTQDSNNNKKKAYKQN